MAVSETLTTRPRVLASRLIPAPHTEILKAIEPKAKGARSFGLITSDRDHPLYVALDEATKASPITVIYARSLYSGNSGTVGPLAGEAIGIVSGSDDEVVREGLKSAQRTLEERLEIQTTAGTRAIPFFSHVVSSIGQFLETESGISAGSSLAYLIAPPLESIFALDAALKAANVRLIKHFAPPTETNVGGGCLAGPLEECYAAAQAFSRAIIEISEAPLETLDRFVFHRK